MLKTIKDLDRCALLASDGNIGKVGDVLVDDEHWMIRYLVANTGSYLFGRTVLIAPAAFGTLDWGRNALNLNVTKEQVEKSPGLGRTSPCLASSRRLTTATMDGPTTGAAPASTATSAFTAAWRRSIPWRRSAP